MPQRKALNDADEQSRHISLGKIWLSDSCCRPFWWYTVLGVDTAEQIHVVGLQIIQSRIDGENFREDYQDLEEIIHLTTIERLPSLLASRN